MPPHKKQGGIGRGNHGMDKGHMRGMDAGGRMSQAGNLGGNKGGKMGPGMNESGRPGKGK